MLNRPHTRHLHCEIKIVRGDRGCQERNQLANTSSAGQQNTHNCGRKREPNDGYIFSVWRSKEERKVNIREKPIPCLIGSAGEKAERAGGNIQISQRKSLVKD